MENRRWVNPTQPQTLQIAVFLLYINAFLGLLGFRHAIHATVNVLTMLGGVLAGLGIANERKWGYAAAIGVAILPFLDRIAFRWNVGDAFAADPLSLMFEIALVALLLHPQSRDYQRIWFK